jgi:HMG box factor
MIMSIPYANKLKVLEKISPPLAPPDGTPQFETRGPVIAIEGPNPSLVRQVGAIIERALAASGECVVRSWSSAAQTPPSSSGSGTDRGTLKFSGYLQTIQEWHGRSEEIVRYITTVPESERRSSAVSMSEGGDTGKKSSVSDQGDASSSTTSEAVSNTSATTPIPSRSQRKGSSHLLPVALLTDGFSLTLSDRFACRVPIGDSYAPVDHWQWMATLWRGIVGPDLVVYVRSPEEEEMRDGRLQAVELKGVGIMMVRVVNPGQGEMVVGEKVERRLGFEVVEWVRSGSFKEGF